MLRRLKRVPVLGWLRNWVVDAPSGTVRHDHLLFAYELSRLAANPRARAKIFLVAMLMRIHDGVPALRRLGVWLRIQYGGRTFRFFVARQSDLYVLQEVLGEREYDYPELPDPDTVLDLGSHIGASLLHFRARYPNARIIGIEPSPETFKRLVKNAPGLDVEIHQLAVVTRDGPVPFYPEWDASISSTRPPRGGIDPVIVEGLTLASLRRRLGLRSVDLLKVDIEAGEAAVIAAAGDVRAIVGEFHESDDAAARREFISLFDGFELRTAQKPDRRLETFAAVKRR
jgi:FkbM family methyltransferase